jgi:putative CocE/NonD family hydrolase
VTTTLVADHPLGVQVERRVPAVMSDGVTLYADIFRPRGVGPWPVLLMRQPYGRLIASTITYAHPSWYARRGFMVVIQDVRGRGDSEGAFYPFADETADGLATIEWAAALPGSNGRVGMYGFSYQGITQLLAAGKAPPALRAICPAMTAGDLPRTWFYLNGLLRLQTAMGWGTQLARDGAKHAGLVERQDELVLAMGAVDRTSQTLPIESYPLLKREDLGRHFFDWIAHPRADDYWEGVGMADRWSQVTVPALHVAGWHDQYLIGTVDNYRRLRAEAATPFARDQQRLIVGPWAHWPWTRHVGLLDFGPEANSPIDELQVTWLSRWLRTEAPVESADRRNGHGPVVASSDLFGDDRVRVFVMGANRWQTCPDWPPAPAETLTFYLGSDGRANSIGGDGRLGRAVPRDEPPDVFLYDPRIATPSGEPGPAPQRAIENRPDVLVYTSEPLTEPIVVAGAIEVTLWAATTAEDTDFMVRVTDVSPDGTSRSVVLGGMRARWREDGSEPTWLEPERPYRFDFALPPTCQMFAAGHRIRVQVASAAFPLFDRNPNCRVNPVAAHARDFQLASQVVLHDQHRPSQIRLPLAPAHWIVGGTA